MATIDEIITGLSNSEREVNEKISDLKRRYGHVFDELRILEAQLDEIGKSKEEVKQLLISAEDYDLHKVNGVRVSVCPVVKLEVSDIDAVEDKYKTTEVVANVKKAQEVKKLFGELPSGFKDKTYYRLTWKEDGNAE